MKLSSLATSLLSPWTERRLRRYRAVAERIVVRSNELSRLGDDEFTQLARHVGWQARSGTSLRRLLPEVFALVREASRRVLSMPHFPMQIMGGIALFEGRIVEMQTGEGKTLTAALPAVLHAVCGLGCHVITANDYLARRDAEIQRPVYERLGLTVGTVCGNSTPEERRMAYRRDITYGTATEIGFDFLRDRLQQPSEFQATSNAYSDVSDSTSRVQRGHHFALIDEADSILIDEARTPLIIGLEEPNDPATVHLYRWCRKTVKQLRFDEDFTYEPEHRRVKLTNGGCRNVLLSSKSTLMGSINTERIYQHIELALTAELSFQRDRDYVIVDDRVHIVDESTGRFMEGRKWQQGLHQSVEAKEQLPITAATGEAARITLQSFFRLYTHAAGMTGTARPASRELKHVYGLPVTVVPTHRPCIRQALPTRIFVSMEAKRRAVVNEIAQRHASGQPILVGTPSVAASEALGALLARQQLPHQILNAHRHDEEAELTARAGDIGQITIATNMAGRGTDIHIGPQARSVGGLHVIATEMHSSARIDRQLVGRAARQGDPGSFQFFVSLEDELFCCLPPELLHRRRQQAQPGANGELSAWIWMAFFRRTQRSLERLHASQRRELFRQEKRRTADYRRMGLDPCLELTES